MSGKDASMKLVDQGITIEEHLQKASFQFFQGARLSGMIAAKAVALELARTKDYQQVNLKNCEKMLELYRMLCRSEDMMLYRWDRYTYCLVNLQTKILVEM